MKATQIFGVALVLYGLFSLAVTFGFYRANLDLYSFLNPLQVYLTDMATEYIVFCYGWPVGMVLIGLWVFDYGRVEK
jgi:hypothetical protein